MKKIPIWLAAILLSATACDDNTGTLGITNDNDQISVSYNTFELKSTTILADSIISNSNTSCFGQVTDPETGTKIKADFLAQFHVMENYKLPAYDSIVSKDNDGKVLADSIEIKFYFQKYYGDPENILKMKVYELDKQNIIREDSVYYSNLDLTQYVADMNNPLAIKTFSPIDHTVDDGILDGSSYYDNVRIKLPVSCGSYILNKYYEHPEYFKDSYSFIRNVCPGYYFNLAQGNGTMLYFDVGTLDIYFSYIQNDSVYSGMTRFAATQEVIQSTHIENSGTEKLLNQALQSDSTYIKTPAGLYTELELPVDDIYKNHTNDSVNTVKITLTKYNKFTTDTYPLGTPQTLLMVRKQDMYSFFEDKKNANSITSYTTSFNMNQYTFSNIARLISYCKTEKRNGAKEEGISEEEWVKKNPDWNKVVLIPVQVTTDQYGYATTTALDLELNSICLVGEKTPIKLYVTYSRFSK